MNQLKSIYNSPFKDSYSHHIHTHLAMISSNVPLIFIDFEQYKAHFLLENLKSTSQLENSNIAKLYLIQNIIMQYNFMSNALVIYVCKTPWIRQKFLQGAEIKSCLKWAFATCCDLTFHANLELILNLE